MTASNIFNKYQLLQMTTHNVLHHTYCGAHEGGLDTQYDKLANAISRMSTTASTAN